MEIMLLILGVLIIGTLILPWVNLARHNGLRGEIRTLYAHIRELESRLLKLEPKDRTEKAKPVHKPLSTPPMQKTESGIHLYNQEPETREELKPAENLPEDDFGNTPEKTVQPPEVNYFTDEDFNKTTRHTSTDETFKNIKTSFEQNIATKLPVWIGAISLICAAFFLVKYSIDSGWLEEKVRVLLGAMFGAAMISTGQWFSNNKNTQKFSLSQNLTDNAKLISQALVGAGIVALYFATYAATQLYDILPPLIGFGGMALTTALAVILSMRHGQIIAAFGLIGGLLTPILIDTNAPSAIAMFSYLFLLFGFMFAILVKKGWWILATLAVIGTFCWSGLWILFYFVPDDAFILVLFAIGITGTILATTGKRIAEDTLESNEHRTIHALNLISIIGGVLTVSWLSLEIQLSLFDFATLGLFSAALMALNYFKPETYKIPLLAKFGATLLLTTIWALSAQPLEATLVVLGFATLYIGGATFMLRQSAQSDQDTQDPRFWAGLQIITALAFYAIAYFTIPIPSQTADSFGLFWGIISLIAAGIITYQITNIRAEDEGSQRLCDHIIAIYALGASAFITAGLAIELPLGTLPIAIATQMAATAWIYKRYGISFLKTIMLILLGGFALLNFGILFESVSDILKALFNQRSTTSGIEPDRIAYYASILRHFIIPAIATTLTLWFVRTRDNKQNLTFTHIFTSATLLLATAASYYILRDILSSNPNATAGFIQRGIMTIICALCGISIFKIASRKTVDLAHLKTYGQIFFHVAIARYIYFDLFALNPYFTEGQHVGAFPLLNGITLTYGATLALCIYALKDNITSFKKPFAGLALITIFTLTSLTVRQLFNGTDLHGGIMSAAELYSYSALWLLTGLALVTYGIKNQDKPTRMASLAFILLAIAKVFLFDAAALEGLYRIFSFAGLGVSLIALSYFYTKFVFSDELAKERT